LKLFFLLFLFLVLKLSLSVLLRLFFVSVLLAGTLGKIMINEVNLSDPVGSNTALKYRNAATLVNGEVVSFLNGNGNILLGSSTISCTSTTTCGFVYNHASKKSFTLSLEKRSFLNSIVSFQGQDKKWRIYVGGKISDTTETSLKNGKIVTIESNSNFILVLNKDLELEEVITFTPNDVALNKLTSFNNKLIAFCTARKTPSVYIKGDEREYAIDSTLLTTTSWTFVGLGDFGSEVLSVQKIASLSKSFSPVFLNSLPNGDNELIAISFLLTASTSFSVNDHNYEAVGADHGFTVIINLSSANGVTRFNILRVIDSEIQGTKSLTSVLLDKDTIAVSQSVGANSFEGCPSGSVTLATYKVADGSRISLKCTGKLATPTLYSAMAPYNNEMFLFISSFDAYLMVDDIVLWFNSGNAGEIDVPFVALVSKKTLVFKDARSVFPDSDPSELYQPVGLVQGSGIFSILYSYNAINQQKYTFRLSQVSFHSCENGVFDSTGACICFDGGVANETNPCRAYNPGSSGDDTPSNISSLNDESKLHENGGFFESLTAMIIFGCTTAVFLVLSIVFISLFSKRRCSSSSSRDVEMN